MVDTFQAIAATLLAILPGAAYTFGYERVVGSFGVNLSDRFVRFFAASAVFHAVAAALTYNLYRDQFLTKDLSQGRTSALTVEGIALVYALVPYIAGLTVGNGRRRAWRWAVALTGTAIEPRAWDFVFSRQPKALVRLRLKSGRWIGGIFATAPDGRRSYAAGYPEAGIYT
jgi:hypothetical protein